MIRYFKKAQTLSEMTIMIVVVLSALAGMQVYVKRGIQAKVKSGIDFGVGLANKAIEKYDTEFNPKDHAVYTLLRCVERCEVTEYDADLADQYQQDNAGDWLTPYLLESKRKCIQSQCVEPRSHMLQDNVNSEQVLSVLASALDQQTRMYDYDTIMLGLYLPHALTSGSNQYEAYYTKRDAEYDIEQASTDNQKDATQTKESYFRSELYMQSESSFNLNDNN